MDGQDKKDNTGVFGLILKIITSPPQTNLFLVHENLSSKMPGKPLSRVDTQGCPNFFVLLIKRM